MYRQVYKNNWNIYTTITYSITKSHKVGFILKIKSILASYGQESIVS